MQRFPVVKQLSENAKVKTILSAALSLLLIFTAVSAKPAHAVSGSTNVNTSVCNGQTGAFLSITSPASDTTIASLTTELKGTISNIGLIELYINDMYDQTVSVASGARSFTIPLSLQAGTNTIKANGYTSGGCQAGMLSDSVVVTSFIAAGNSENSASPIDNGQSTQDKDSVVGGLSDAYSAQLPVESRDQITIIGPLGPALIALDFDSFSSVRGAVNSLVVASGIVALSTAAFGAILSHSWRGRLTVGGVILVIAGILFS